MFEWGDVRVFLAVRARGSFTAAAKELAMDQTTVGRRVAALETALGARLFRRGRAGLTLTPAGEEMLVAARGMEESALAVDRAARGHDGSPTGAVRVTTVETFASRFLAPRLVELRRRHPGLLVELVSSTHSFDLARREADLAVRLAKPQHPGLAARRIGTMAYALYASPAYLASRRAPPADLRAHDVLGYDGDLQAMPEATWLAERTPRAPVLRTNSLATLEAATAAGLGVAVLPCWLADGRADLVRVMEPGEVVARDIWLVVHEELRRQARIRVTADFVAREVGRARDALLGR